ncbi:hypothetical protein GTA08_BOTSDO10422 [Neofusicoccum parvum]|uniref:Uncharacterized protein n=1 Tax=Neofusicoccum parvum TaxID=310453 RepID=A0ACB5SR25_9PEZI|nr:hypothetical protein GTA08_BOTSDO10422 [Neofusicoccum parvum]
MASPASHPPVPNCIISFPTQQILLVTLNRPKQLNCIDVDTSRQMQRLWEWFDQNTSLVVGVITGSGRAFCTGADLNEWNRLNASGQVSPMDAPGLAGLPRRRGRKPVIAAVNGICMGGGFEMTVNCDLVVAARKAVFALPEVKRGIAAVAGSLPRLTRIIGKQRAVEMALTGRNVTAQELHCWGLVNRVTGDGEGEVVRAAVELAEEICRNSPDGVMVSKEGINLGWEKASVEDGSALLIEGWYGKLMAGANFKEGIRAFAEKREPQWVPSKL